MFLKQQSGSAAASAEGLRGRGISIAVLDTGISPVADFIEPKNRILAFLDLVNGKKEPYDDNGHGTQLTESTQLSILVIRLSFFQKRRCALFLICRGK